MAILEIQNLVKNYFGEVTVEVLKGIDLKVEKGSLWRLWGLLGAVRPHY